MTITMKHYGDVGKINGSKIEPVDIITFGSPCQDMSVAGKRRGMKHAEQGDEETTRSGLFYEAIRIIKEMRDATNGEYPKYAVWENVPGSFSSNKGWDFHAVLEALCSVSDSAVSIPKPYDTKRTKLVWNKAGEIVGDNYSVAWRTLDAQYWGVPQRRKRIYLVADFTGRCAGEILFKPDSLRGYMPQGNESREETTTNVMGGTNGSVGGPDAVGFDSYNLCSTGSVGRTVTTPSGGLNEHIPLVAYSFDSLSSNSMKSRNPFSGCRAVEIAKCIDTTYPDPSKNQGGIAIIQPLILKERAGCEGGGKGALWSDKAFTLATNQDMSVICQDGSETARTLAARYDSSPCVDRGQNVVCYDARGNGDGETACTITGDHQNRITDYTAVAVQEAKPPRRYIIRRLTPTECARLQGFPDKWGELAPYNPADAEFWEDVRKTHAEINGKKYKPVKDIKKWYNKLHTDSAEYKMWGNGIALPNARYVMQGIAEQGAKTLGSLFDGSGGFPLAGALNGIKPLWASEVEPYPIAVTKSRFKEVHNG